jgi:hypothetical protein
VGLVFAASTTACGHGGRAASPTTATTGTPVATVAQPSVSPAFAAFDTHVDIGGCPPPAKCFRTLGHAGYVGGVGPVDEQHVLVEHDSKSGCATLSGNVLWQVVGKGTITFAVETPDCQPEQLPTIPIVPRTLDYVVTGGAGAFKGASGRGQLSWIPSGGSYDVWVGSLRWKNGRATPEGSSRASMEPP